MAAWALATATIVSGCGRVAEPEAPEAMSPMAPDAPIAAEEAGAPRVGALDAGPARVDNLDVTWTGPAGWTPSANPSPHHLCFAAPAAAHDAERAEACVTKSRLRADEIVGRWDRLFPGVRREDASERVGGVDVGTTACAGDRAYGWDGDVPVFPKQGVAFRAALVDLGEARAFFELMGSARAVAAHQTEFQEAWRSFVVASAAGAADAAVVAAPKAP